VATPIGTAATSNTDNQQHQRHPATTTAVQTPRLVHLPLPLALEKRKIKARNAVKLNSK